MALDSQEKANSNPKEVELKDGSRWKVDVSANKDVVNNNSKNDKSSTNGVAQNNYATGKNNFHSKGKKSNKDQIGSSFHTSYTLQIFSLFFALLLSGTIHFNNYPPSPFMKVYRHDELQAKMKLYGGINETLPSSFTGYTIDSTSDNSLNITSGWMKLSQGYTFYKVYSPFEEAKGYIYNVERKLELPPLVLIHGFASNSKIWEARNIAREIALRSHREVLIYDNYGRGRSDAVFPNTESLFSGQLAELLIALYGDQGLKSDPGGNVAVDIMGISMGGSIATSFAYRYPQLIRKVVLIAPAGLPVTITLPARIASTPFLGDWLTYFFGPMMLKSHIKKGYFNQTDPFLVEQMTNTTTLVDQQRKAHRGFMPSLLSTTRYYPLSNLQEQIRSMGQYLASPMYSKNYQRHLIQKYIPRILVIWGDKDVVCPFENANKFVNLLNGRQGSEENTIITSQNDGNDIAKLLILENYGHVDMINKEESVVDFLRTVLDFFQK